MIKKIVLIIIKHVLKLVILPALFLLIIIIFLQNKEDQKEKIAILKLDPINIEQKIVDTITETLVTTIANGNKYDVVERSKINKIFEELKLSNSDDFENNEIIEIGKLSKAKFILIGSLSRLDNKYIINIRVINVTSGEIVFGDNTSCNNYNELYESTKIIANKISGIKQDKIEINNTIKNEKEITKNNFKIPEYIFTDNFDTFNTNLWKNISKNNDVNIEAKNGVLQFSAKFNPDRLNSINSITSKEFKLSSFAIEISFKDILSSCESFYLSIVNTNWYYGNSVLIKVNLKKEYYCLNWSIANEWHNNNDKVIYELFGDENKNFHRFKIAYDLDNKTLYGYIDDKLIDILHNFNFDRTDKLEISLCMSESNYNTNKDILFVLDNFKSSIDLK